MTYIEKKSAKKSTNCLEKVFFKYENSIFRESCKLMFCSVLRALSNEMCPGQNRLKIREI